MITTRDVTVVLPSRGPGSKVAAFIQTLQHPADQILLVVKAEEQDAILANQPDLKQCSIVNDPSVPTGFCQIHETGIMAVQTSHWIGLADDLVIPPGTIAKAVERWNQALDGKGGVLKLKHHSTVEDDFIACFVLMSKAFYAQHCYPTPYLYFWHDTDWTVRARHLDCYFEADNEPIFHPASAHHLPEWEIDKQTFIRRCTEFGAQDLISNYAG